MIHTIRKETGTFISFDGTPIYYELRGEGPPVIFVYGIACLINHWHHQIRHFSPSMTTVAFDLRGHHRSQPVADRSQLSMEALGRDLVLLVEGLGLSAAHIVGHSFGAPVMLAAYQQNPQIFRSMTFINGFARNPVKGMFGLDVVEPFFHFAKNTYEKSPLVWDTLWRMAVDNPVSMRLAAMVGGFNIRLTHFKDIEVYARGVAHLDLPIFMAEFEALMGFDGGEILRSVQVPTLIIAGENDNVTPKSFQEDLQRGIPHSEFLLVPYGSHCTQLDYPDYVNLKLSEFWRKCDQQG